jgi:hypothetical protein
MEIPSMLPTQRIRFMMATWLLALMVMVQTVSAQEAQTVKAIDLSTAPQRYWAQFFVFSDTLRDKPSLSSQSIDGRNVFAFRTAVAGTVYAEYEAAKTLATLTEGEEHMFYATVTQRKGAMWGLLPFGRDFVVIVKSVGALQAQPRGVAPVAVTPQAAQTDAASQPSDLHNMILDQLDKVMKDVHKDMYGYAQSQGIPLEEVMSSEKYRDRVNASIRTAIRKTEDQQRTTAYEFFINSVWAMMAELYIDPTAGKPEYAPEEFIEEGEVMLEAEPALEPVEIIEEEIEEENPGLDVESMPEDSSGLMMEYGEEDIPENAAEAVVDEISEPLPELEVESIEEITPPDAEVAAEEIAENTIESIEPEAFVEETAVEATEEIAEVAEDISEAASGDEIAEQVVETVEEVLEVAPEAEVAVEETLAMEAEAVIEAVVEEVPLAIEAIEPVIETTIPEIDETIIPDATPLTPPASMRGVPEPVPAWDEPAVAPAPVDVAPLAPAVEPPPVESILTEPPAVEPPPAAKPAPPPLRLDTPIPRRAK